MRDSTDSACDEIDAAIFTGDEFHDATARKELRDYMARWERELKVLEDIDKQVPGD